ncbi:hypothetical protein LCGC14_0556950 [marine sediment metagenome]|uniref:Peptidase C39-like domain-containing protein n=1 Tax=marine sediment metagenome TaxID=412755 RepID=A0A0F9S6R0_9ZZZZ
MRRTWHLIVLLGLTAALSACAGRPPLLPEPQTLQHLPPQILLEDVKFYAQDAYQCGPAALAMMFDDRGITVTPNQLVDRVYIPERKGTLQVEMISAARERDLLVYTLNRNLETVLAELAAGNPVLVMQNLAFNWFPQWHYAVVVGYDLDREVMLVHSGLNRAQAEPFKLFMRTWSRANRWATVMLPPGQLPASAEPLKYLAAASDLEQTGRLDSARAAYQAALIEWPEQPAARFGLGNVAWAQNKREQAIEHFRVLGLEHPTLKAGWHNLSAGLKAMGCNEAAQQASACLNRLNNKQAPDKSPACKVASCPKIK